VRTINDNVPQPITHTLNVIPDAHHSLLQAVSGLQTLCSCHPTFFLH
jgi:hypothetical protein